jgi:hypothetical protein
MLVVVVDWMSRGDVVFRAFVGRGHEQTFKIDGLHLHVHTPKHTHADERVIMLRVPLTGTDINVSSTGNACLTQSHCLHTALRAAHGKGLPEYRATSMMVLPQQSS